MRKKRYFVELSDDQRQRFERFIRGGTTRARPIDRVRILLHAADGTGDQEIATALHTSLSTVWHIRKRFTEDGLEGALHDVVRPGGKRKLTGEQEAYVIALACSTSPEGRREWTMQLLADQVVTLGLVETISDETIRRTLKKGRQTLAARAVVYPDGECCVCLADGGRAGVVCRPTRSTPSGRLFLRAALSGARCQLSIGAALARRAAEGRLRGCPAGDLQLLRLLCAAPRRAAHSRDRPSHRPGFR